ncbi:hypothetical protein PIB30_082315 [Stylosanthes scabra]|uniref:Uncharacterized protein n=1 Tax=Stylosanthes scabra TaxID=79078 RepID=A0ABU6SS94_9FABA|nr:hypothetical protein [Stylosanthes scabra]
MIKFFSLNVPTARESRMRTARTWFLTSRTTIASTTFQSYALNVGIDSEVMVISNSISPSASIGYLIGKDLSAKPNDNTTIEFLEIEVEEEQEMASPLPIVNTYTLCNFLFFTKDPEIHNHTSHADPFARMKLKFASFFSLFLQILHFLVMIFHNIALVRSESSGNCMCRV